jgi:prevent-host-death family protein
VPEIGVRELKKHASEIVRQVREQGVRYIITYRGHPVGVLLPLQESSLEERLLNNVEIVDPWQELMELGQEIGLGWRTSKTSAELLAEMRR